eukprot:g2222.t1
MGSGGSTVSKERRLQKRNETFVTLNEISFPTHINNEPMENVEEILKPIHWDIRKNASGEELLGGALWTELIRSALVRIFENMGHINHINVFPVADRDTGRNMFNTIRGGTIAILKNRSNSLGDITERFAQGAMMKSQGQSGVCFTFFASILAKELSDTNSVPVQEVMGALERVGNQMKNAVHNPKEGTMISLVRDSIASLVSKFKADRFKTIRELFDYWFCFAKEELKNTMHQLVVDNEKLLENRAVVDSGAQGFVYFLDGMRSFLSARNTLNFDSDFLRVETIDLPMYRVTKCFDNELGELSRPVVIYEYFQYRIEIILVLKKGYLPAHAEKLFSLAMGDNIRVCAAGNMVKCHVHTNEPESTIESAESLALKYDVLSIKVEDLHVDVRNSRLLQPDLTPQNKKATVQVVYTGITEAPKYLEGVALPWCAHFQSIVFHEKYVDNVTISSNDISNLCRRELIDSFVEGNVTQFRGICLTGYPIDHINI